MDFVGLTIQALKVLSNIAGSYGLGIILLTVIVRMAMWPLSVSQQRSMKQMQTLQPRMKAIQERYKNDPQTMQRKMMELPFRYLIILLKSYPFYFCYKLRPLSLTALRQSMS